MPLPPLTHQLSNFEQIEILRHEIDLFEEELKKTESRIRDVLYLAEKQRFLKTVHSVFNQTPISAEEETLPEMYTSRETSSSALDAMKQLLASLEASSGPAPARLPQRPPPGATRVISAAPPLQSPLHTPGQAQPNNAPVRKNRFDAF